MNLEYYIFNDLYSYAITEVETRDEEKKGEMIEDTMRGDI